MWTPPLDHEDWVGKLDGVGAIRGRIAENIDEAHDRQVKQYNKHQKSLT